MVNPYNLVTFLKGQSEITMSEIICKVTQGVGPIRNPKSKYHVSVGEYKDDYYPPYCQGMYHYHTYSPTSKWDNNRHLEVGQLLLIDSIYRYIAGRIGTKNLLFGLF